MDAVKAISIAVVMPVFALSCGLWADSGPPPVLPETWLSDLIRTVPSDMGADYLLFANYHEARLAADATGFEGFDTFIAEGPGSVPWTYAMLPAKGMFMSYSESAREIIGLDPLGWTRGYGVRWRGLRCRRSRLRVADWKIHNISTRGWGRRISRRHFIMAFSFCISGVAIRLR